MNNLMPKIAEKEYFKEFAQLRVDKQLNLWYNVYIVKYKGVCL